MSGLPARLRKWPETAGRRLPVRGSRALADSRLGPQWTEAVVFAYLIAIMILRPRGLLGEETREAG